MHFYSRRFITFCFLAVFSSLIFFSPSHAGDVVNLTLGLHQAEIVPLPQAMSQVIIADRSVAGVVRHGGNKVSIIGHGYGHTDIRFMNSDKRIIRQVNVHVTYNLPELRYSIKKLFPEEQVGVELVNESIALTGEVTDAETATRMVKIAEDYVRKENQIVDEEKQVLNLMKIRAGQQIMLRVRVGELKRDVLKNMGLGLHAVITAGSATIGLLERNEVFRVLAEPTLVAISGETAKFLAGGEFPVPIAQQGGTMSVDYKPFGVGVEFTPRVLSENRIRLTVTSEVSELSTAGAVTMDTIKIPSIATRRSQTTVELGSGESFMIAGLLRDDSATKISEVPGLADIPILNALFRSSAFQRNETELVVAVTPYFVDPVEEKDIRLPTDEFRHPNALEMFFYGALGAHSAQTATTGSPLEGPVGFMVE